MAAECEMDVLHFLYHEQIENNIDNKHLSEPVKVSISQQIIKEQPTDQEENKTNRLSYGESFSSSQRTRVSYIHKHYSLTSLKASISLIVAPLFLTLACSMSDNLVGPSLPRPFMASSILAFESSNRGGGFCGPASPKGESRPSFLRESARRLAENLT